MTSSFWKNVPLSNVLIERKEKPSDEALATGATRIVSKISFNDGLIQLRQEAKTKTGMILIRPGDLVVSGINAAKGAIAIFDQKESEPIAATIHYGAYIPDSKQIDVRYLWWLLRSNTFRDLLNQYVPGGIKTELKAKRLLSIPVPIPPLHEQKRVVSRIESLAAKIEQACHLRDQTISGIGAFLQSDIASIFKNGKDRGWDEKPLGAYVVDDCYGTSEKTTDDASGMPILRMGNIQNGRLDVKNLKYLHLNDADGSKLILQKGDIVVNRTNSAELVGKCAVFDLDGKYGFASYLIRLRLDSQKVDPYLVAAYINSPLGRTYMFNEKKQMTGQANVNATKLKALPIALPRREDQLKIVAYLDGLRAKVNGLKKIQYQTALELDDLLPSVLDKAFKGEM